MEKHTTYLQHIDQVQYARLIITFRGVDGLK